MHNLKPFSKGRVAVGRDAKRVVAALIDFGFGQVRRSETIVTALEHGMDVVAPLGPTARAGASRDAGRSGLTAAIAAGALGFFLLAAPCHGQTRAPG